MEIKKLADVVVWADNWIKELRFNLTEEEFEEDEEVKQFETVKKVVLDAMKRHTVYINALESLIKVRNNQEKEIEAHEAENARLSEKITKLKKELDKSYKAWNTDSKNHQKRDMTLVDEIAKKNKEIKELKEENLRLISGRVDTDFVNKLIQETDYYKDQERIRTDQLRATESKVDQLYKELDECKEENSYLKKQCKTKNDIIKKAYDRYVDEACKSREEIMNECYEKLTKDETGYTGFKIYVRHALEAQEGNEKEAKKFICNTADIIFRNKRSEEKRKEETEVKGVGRTSYGIPCGEDSIE